MDRLYEKKESEKNVSFIGQSIDGDSSTLRREMNERDAQGMMGNKQPASSVGVVRRPITTPSAVGLFIRNARCVSIDTLDTLRVAFAAISRFRTCL